MRTRTRVEHEVHRAERLSEPQEVGVGVHDPRENGSPGQVEPLGARARERQRPAGAADEGDPPGAHGERLGGRPVGVGGVDPGVQYHEVRRLLLDQQQRKGGEHHGSRCN